MDIIQDVYDTLTGQLEPEYAVPWVKNAFDEGQPCQKAYSDMLAAYDRLLQRLNETDEDADVEEILTCLLTIQWELSREMFLCGVEFARRMEKTSHSLSS